MRKSVGVVEGQAVRYRVLATDYDGTLASGGRADAGTLEALARLRASGRKLVLVTGRQLEDLAEVLPELRLFDRIVAENGAVVYWPERRSRSRLADPPPPEFLDALARRGVQPLSVGEVIAATWQPHEHAVLEAIRETGLELQVTFNKGAVMILPSGVNKGTGLLTALDELRMSFHNVVGIGDGENDHALLAACECGVAVANAVDSLKTRADLTTAQGHGAGVRALVEQILEDDLAKATPRLSRHEILLGHREDETEVTLSPYGAGVLIAGSSGAGKSDTTKAIVERLVEGAYQVCLVDPEGDYDGFESLSPIGDAQTTPSVEQVAALLDSPSSSLRVNLLGLPLDRRPDYFEALFTMLWQMRAQFGRPHWIVLDEAHHLVPASWQPAAMAIPLVAAPLLLVTVDPGHLAPAILGSVETVLALGPQAHGIISAFCRLKGDPVPKLDVPAPDSGYVLYWSRSEPQSVMSVRIAPHQAAHRRHLRKYAEGELGPDKSFYFRGPDGRLNLRAQNLVLFLQLSDGVDDATWSFHLHRGDYSRWLRTSLKDGDLADQVRAVEEQPNSPPNQTRRFVRQAIEQRYGPPV